MTKEEIYAFLNANPVVYLATVEGNMPRVRGMMLFKADENGIVFHTGPNKDMTRQIAENPAVELCVFDPQSGVQVRVSGTAEFFDDHAMKDAMAERLEFMKPLIEQFGYDALTLFRVKGCTANVWTMESNMEPKTYLDLC